MVSFFFFLYPSLFLSRLDIPSFIFILIYTNCLNVNLDENQQPTNVYDDNHSANARIFYKIRNCVYGAIRTQNVRLNEKKNT